MESLKVKKDLFAAILINKEARINFNNLLDTYYQKAKNNTEFNPRLSIRHQKVARDMYFLAYKIEVWISHIIDRSDNYIQQGTEHGIFGSVEKKDNGHLDKKGIIRSEDEKDNEHLDIIDWGFEKDNDHFDEKGSMISEDEEYSWAPSLPMR
jgi:hypothetical protein